MVLTGRRIIGFIFLGFGLLGGIAGATENLVDIAEFLPQTIFFLFVGALLAIFRGKTPEEKPRALHEMAAYQAKQARRMSAIHIAGLPVASGVNCELEFIDNVLYMRSCGNLIQLSTGKMISAVIKTNIDIQIDYVSDTGGAVAGAMNFGWLGALIGGGIQKIETEIKSYFLIVTYIINEADKQLEQLL